jgi:hypothetical protein
MKIRDYFTAKPVDAPDAQRDGVAKKPRHRTQQARLSELAKVLVLPTSYMNPDQHEIDRLKALLGPGTPDRQVVEALRTLDCYQMSLELLLETQIGRAVRLLPRQQRQGQGEIGERAAGLVAKWSQLVRQESRFARKQQLQGQQHGQQHGQHGQQQHGQQHGQRGQQQHGQRGQQQHGQQALGR